MNPKYETLIEDFCALVNLDDAQHIVQGGAIEVNGVVFSFIHNPAIDMGLLFLYTDFGPPPLEYQAAVYGELLKHNFMHFAGKGPAFTISPFTGHVVHVEHFPIETTVPQLLASTMAYMADQAKDWKATRFLSGPNALKPARAA